MEHYLKKMDLDTYCHSIRVMCLAEMFGRKLGFKESEIKILGEGALFHDVGKINIDEKILLKEGKLSDQEYNLIKEHSEMGYNLAKNKINDKKILDMILSHHERVDGKGYPFNKKESEISTYSKIINMYFF